MDTDKTASQRLPLFHEIEERAGEKRRYSHEAMEQLQAIRG
jgi:hypothetical protein